MSIRHITRSMHVRVRAAVAVASAAVLALTGASWVAGAPARAEPQPLVSQQWGITLPTSQHCQEDDPCWRVWMGDGTYGSTAPDYMFAPEGVPQSHADSPCFRGAVRDASNPYCPGQPLFPHYAPHSFYYLWGPEPVEPVR